MSDTDIINRLNAVTENSMYNEPWTTNQLCFDAAKEIQKLRAQISERNRPLRGGLSLLQQFDAAVSAAASGPRDDYRNHMTEILRLGRAHGPEISAQLETVEVQQKASRALSDEPQRP